MDGLLPSWDSIERIIVSALGIYAAVILFTRLAGLRSFSKASSFDFAMTVAVGSIVASTMLNDKPPLPEAIVALALLYVLQIGVGIARQKWGAVQRLVDNEPRLLMAGPRVLHHNLEAAQITEDDLRAKLREAGVLSYEDVQAVVLETTGEFSVLTGSARPESDLFRDVRGAELLDTR